MSVDEVQYASTYCRQVEQLLQGQEDSQGNINYENFVHLIMQGWADPLAARRQPPRAFTLR